jgi:DNA-binding winged helix-turn-helix (wHTH) protein/TolB-like protein
MKTSPDTTDVYEFADFRLDVRERILLRQSSGERVPLPDKAFDTLCVLIRNAGRLVGKEELLSSVWADSFVEENNLNKSIHAIRRALGEPSGDQKVIETVKKHGFRFIAEVKAASTEVSAAEIGETTDRQTGDNGSGLHLAHLVPQSDPQSDTSLLDVAPSAEPDSVETEDSHAPGAVHAHRTSSPGSRRFPYYLVLIPVSGLLLVIGSILIYRYVSATDNHVPPRLAVLPLKPLDQNDNYLGFGMTDAIIRRISQTGTLTVRPTSAVRRYLTEETDAVTAAKQLDVDAVLEGTLQRSDNRLRVSVNLLRASDGKSLWAENFDMTSSDIFAIQDKVGQEVARSLQLRIGPAQQARFATKYIPNAIAYEYYLKGVYSFDLRDYGMISKPQHEATIAMFQKSIDADPNFALAHASLAYGYAWMAVYVDGDNQAEWIARAKEEIDRANALDPDLAETHMAHHHILLSATEGFQLEEATREALLARDINPNVGTGELAADFLHLGLEDLFEREMQRAFEIDPTSEFNKNVISILYMNARRYDDWFAQRQKYFDGTPNVQYLLGKGRLEEAEQKLGEKDLRTQDISLRGSKALLLALRGDHSAANAEIPDLIRELPAKNRTYHHATYNLACIYALSGNSADAVKWLRETASSGFPEYPLFERDRYLDPIRQSPEFVQFMSEMKLQNERLKAEFSH